MAADSDSFAGSLRCGACDGYRAEAESGQEDQAEAQAARGNRRLHRGDRGLGLGLLLNAERRPIDPYHEFRHLQVRGRLLQPTGLQSDRVEISLLTSPELITDRRKELEPVALGSLAARPDGISGNIGILGRADADPADADRRAVQVRPDARYQLSASQRQAEQDKADRRRPVDCGRGGGPDRAAEQHGRAGVRPLTT